MRFQKKNNEKWTCRNDADPRCQKEAVPERAKIHLPLGLFDFFIHIFAAQIPTGSTVTSVASGPHTPRPKDYPGLGDPNTLKPKCVKTHACGSVRKRCGSQFEM